MISDLTWHCWKVFLFKTTLFWFPWFQSHLASFFFVSFVGLFMLLTLLYILFIVLSWYFCLSKSLDYLLLFYEEHLINTTALNMSHHRICVSISWIQVATSVTFALESLLSTPHQYIQCDIKICSPIFVWVPFPWSFYFLKNKI